MCYTFHMDKETSICTKCGKEKLKTEFHRNSNNHSGVHYHCKSCRSTLGKEERLKKNTERAERAVLLDEGKQRCSACKEIKTLSSFYKYSKSSSRRKGQCIPCYNSFSFEYRSNPEVKERAKHNLEQRKKKNPYKYKESIRSYALKYKYGLTDEDYTKMLEDQDHKCAICGIHQSEYEKTLYVDHDHNTGEVRGLLCGKCNTGLGMFQDQHYLLENALEYLNRYSI